MAITSAFKAHENKMRHYAERQGYMLIKSPRRDPRAPGFGMYILAEDNRQSRDDPRDPDLIEKAHLRLDRGLGLTIEQIEEKLGYGEAS